MPSTRVIHANHGGDNTATPSPTKVVPPLLADLPDGNADAGEHRDLSTSECVGLELRTAQKPPDPGCRFFNRSRHDSDTVSIVAQPPAEESMVSSEKCQPPSSLEMAQDLLLVIPFRSADLISNLFPVDAPQAELFRLVPRNVVI